MVDTKAFHKLTCGLYIVSAVNSDGRKVGCIANTFEQVASKIPMAAIALNKENTTTKAIEQTKKYVVSVLTQEATMELIGTFGFRESLEIDKYADVEYELNEDGLPIVLEKTCASFEVKVAECIDAHTHNVFVGEVCESRVLDSAAKPLTYDYYHSVLKGKTPPRAASYEPDDNGKSDKSSEPVKNEQSENADTDVVEVEVIECEIQTPKYGWRCRMCGFIIEQDELPDDFVCPICGVGKDMFDRIEL